MALIPERGCPTLAAMRKQMEILQKGQEPRNYLGASLIGHPCSRHIWYAYNNYPRKQIESTGLMAIEDGHFTEKIIADRLMLVPGIELWTVNENGDQFKFVDENIGGHIDGVIKGLIQSPSTPHLWENKSVNQKKFDEFKKIKSDIGEKQTLEKWNKQFWVQAQIYMHYFELNRHYLTVCTPGARDVDACRTEYNNQTALALIEKAKRITKAKIPPEKIGGKDWWECKWCSFYEECHGK